MRNQCIRAAILMFATMLPLLGADDSLGLSKPDPPAAGMNGKQFELIAARMKEYVDANKAAGIVTVVARHGQIASFEAVGYQDLDKRTPMRKDSMFRIASLTKPVTCAAMMILVDEGRIALIDPVEKYLPEYAGLKLKTCSGLSGYACQSVNPSRAINIQDLMTHTSGLPAVGPRGTSEPQTLTELVSQGAKSELLFEPGTHWNYSNIGIDILGRIIEVVSRQPFEEFLRTRIFERLEMHDTSFFVPAGKQSRVATLYTYDHGKLTSAEADWQAQHRAHIPVPAGGLVSTASDMLRFNEMMRRGGTLDGKRVLSAPAVHLMTISHTGELPAGWVPGVGHGYGYEVVREPAGMFRYNSLGTYVKGGAYRTYEWVDLEKDMTGVFMMQLTNGGGDVADPINSFMTISAAAIER
ncbi:MAG: serine hydrolase domain-containing protein [Bryobacteraceae bacterium]